MSLRLSVSLTAPHELSPLHCSERIQLRIPCSPSNLCVYRARAEIEDALSGPGVRANTQLRRWRLHLGRPSASVLSSSPAQSVLPSSRHSDQYRLHASSPASGARQVIGEVFQTRSPPSQSFELAQDWARGEDYYAGRSGGIYGSSAHTEGNHDGYDTHTHARSCTDTSERLALGIRGPSSLAASGIKWRRKSRERRNICRLCLIISH